MATGKTWKDGLLRSSLPLEQLVAEILASEKFFVCGEYSYLRTNETGIETEFSIDLEAFDLLPQRGGHWGNLRLLVECKYNYPTVKWVFASHVNPDSVTGGVIRCYDHLCTQTVEGRDLFQFDRDLEYCVSGIELHENGEVNNQSIARATSQLRYALIESVIREVEVQIETWNDVDLAAAIYCPMIVTTSQLYVLKAGLSLTTFQQASMIQDVAAPVKVLVVSKDNGPELDREIPNKVTTLHRLYPEIKTRLVQLQEITKTDTKVLGPTWSFDHAIRFATENILVVNYDALSSTVRKIRKTVLAAGRRRRRIGKLERDLSRRIKWIEPLAQKSNSG